MDKLFDFLKELTKSKFLFFLVLGIALFLLGLAGGIKYHGWFVISGPWNLVVALVGLALACLGGWGAYTSDEGKDNGKAVEWADKLYTFHGLAAKLQSGSRDEECFQDFNIVRENSRNLNGVYFLWADTKVASRINASILPEAQGFFLRVSFVNKPDGYASNLAIHPQDRRAFQNDPFRRHLRFCARVPAGVDSETGENLDKVGVHVRIVNGHLQHWQNASSPQECIKFDVGSSEWKEITVDLGDNDKWTRFLSDGNHIWGPREPDFSVITSIVFEFGKLTLTGTLGSGAGVIDIKGIKLVR